MKRLFLTLSALFAFFSINLFPLQVHGQSLDEAKKFSIEVKELYSQGKYREAIPLAEKALAIREKALGPNNPDVATSLNDIGTLYYQLGDYIRAESFYNRSLAIREKALGPEHPAVAICLNNLARLYLDIGDYTRAESLQNQSLAIREKALGPDHPDVATSLQGLGQVYLFSRDFTRAELFYKRALAIYEKAFGLEHRNVAICLNDLAGLYNILGDYTRAELLFKQATAIEEKALGPEHLHVAASLNNLGLLYYTLGDYTKAEPLFKRALVITEKARGPDHPDVATSLNNLGLLYYTLGDYTRAESLFKRSLAIREKALGPDHPDVATSLNNLANLYLADKRLDAAYRIFKKQNESICLGRYYLAKGDYAQAEQEFQFSFQKHKGKNVQGRLITTYTGLGLSSEGARKYQDAKEWFMKAIDLIEKQWLSLSSSSRRHFLLGTEIAGFSRLEPYEGMVRVSLKERTERNAAEALQYAERVKSRLFLEQLAAREFKGRTEQDTGVLAKDREFQQQIGVLKKRISVLEELSSKAPSGQKEQLSKELETAAASYEQFLEEIKLKGGDVSSLITVEAATAGKLQGFLDTDTSLLEYYTAKDKTYAWIVTRNDVKAYEIKREGNDLSDKDLTKAVDAWLVSNISKSSRRPTPVITVAADDTYTKETSEGEREKNRELYYQAARKFYDLLIAPVAGNIKTEKLIIVPHGVLHKIPFAALTDGDKYLIDRYSLSVLPAASVLEYVVKKRKPNHKRLLAFANPVTDYVPLGFSEAEVEGISKLFSEKEVYTKAQATEGMAKERSSTPDVIHFACHGEFNDKQPLQSGLLLAKDENNDGYLQVHEIFGMNLQNANLVTLSACETALCKIQGGDDLVGLSRGFIYAGTPSILATLWSVDDRSTAILIRSFYENWQVKGMSKPEALRQAQISLKNIPEYKHPYYWAPFVMVGDWK